MKQLIEYLTAILNIKTDSTLVILDLQSELQSITDIADYQKFMRTNINHLDMNFMTGFQKFIKLTEKYKEKTAEANNLERLSKSSIYAVKLAEKVKDVSSYVLDNNDLNYEHFITPDGCLFESFDIKQLDRVGSLLKCVRLQRTVSGEDALLEKLDANMKQIVMSDALGYNKTEKLPSKTMSAVSALANNVKA